MPAGPGATEPPGSAGSSLPGRDHQAGLSPAAIGMTVVALPETIEGCWTRTVGVALPLQRLHRDAHHCGLSGPVAAQGPQSGRTGCPGDPGPRGRRACGWCPIPRLDTRARFRCSLRPPLGPWPGPTPRASPAGGRRSAPQRERLHLLDRDRGQRLEQVATFSKLSSCCPDQA